MNAYAHARLWGLFQVTRLLTKTFASGTHFDYGNVVPVEIHKKLAE